MQTQFKRRITCTSKADLVYNNMYCKVQAPTVQVLHFVFEYPDCFHSDNCRAHARHEILQRGARCVISGVKIRNTELKGDNLVIEPLKGLLP